MAIAIDWIDWVQRPAMGATVIAAWFVASQSKVRRNWGFWWFILSNILWVLWGLHDRAYALIVLQICLVILNIRGARKNDPEATAATQG